MTGPDDWGDKPVPAVDPESAPFWDAAADGRLVAQRCEDCGEHQLYPRRLCRHCWSRDLAVVDLPGTGTLYSYTECHVAGQPGYEADVPYAVALVDLDLPAPNPSGRPIHLTTHVVDADPEDLVLDDSVTVAFRQVSTDPEIHLPVFEIEA